MLDYHTTDIVGIEWHDGHMRVFERVQTKHHMASPLHYGEISKTMLGLMRLLDGHKASTVDIGEQTRLIGNNCFYVRVEIKSAHQQVYRTPVVGN